MDQILSNATIQHPSKAHKTSNFSAQMASLTELNDMNFDDDMFGEKESESELKWTKVSAEEDEEYSAPGTKCVIRITNNLYSVHKTILGEGFRKSKFCGAKFLRWADTSNKQEVDLTKLLPNPCHQYFETVLDYFYTG